MQSWLHIHKQRLNVWSASPFETASFHWKGWAVCIFAWWALTASLLPHRGCLSYWTCIKSPPPGLRSPSVKRYLGPWMVLKSPILLCQSGLPSGLLGLIDSLPDISLHSTKHQRTAYAGPRLQRGKQHSSWDTRAEPSSPHPSSACRSLRAGHPKISLTGDGTCEHHLCWVYKNWGKDRHFGMGKRGKWR